MTHVVNSPSGWRVKFECHWINLLGNFKWSMPQWAYLTSPTLLQESKVIHKHIVTHLEGVLAFSLIIVLCGACLCALH